MFGFFRQKKRNLLVQVMSLLGFGGMAAFCVSGCDTQVVRSSPSDGPVFANAKSTPGLYAQNAGTPQPDIRMQPTKYGVRMPPTEYGVRMPPPTPHKCRCHCDRPCAPRDCRTGGDFPDDFLCQPVPPPDPEPDLPVHPPPEYKPIEVTPPAPIDVDPDLKPEKLKPSNDKG